MENNGIQIVQAEPEEVVEKQPEPIPKTITIEWDEAGQKIKWFTFDEKTFRSFGQLKAVLDIAKALAESISNQMAMAQQQAAMQNEMIRQQIQAGPQMHPRRIK